MTDAPKIILMWANSDPKYPNSFVIKDGERKLLGLTRTDKNGQTYWKFKERKPKAVSQNNSESSPVMDNVQKFYQRQAKTEALNYDKNNSAATTNSVNQHNNPNKQLATLLQERETTEQERQTKDQEIKKITDERKSLLNIASYVREIEHEETRLTTNATTHTPRMNNFLGTGTGTNSGNLNNLYKVKINNSEVETTEEQIINPIACIVSALKKIDKDDFTTKYNAQESDSSKKTRVKDYLTRIQQQEIIVGSDNGSTTDGTFTLPESLDSIRQLKDELEMEKLGAAVKLIESRKQIEDKTQERDSKQAQIKSKETEIDTLISEIITKKREKLQTHNLSKGFAKTSTEDNRRELFELRTIEQLLLEIRYLENDGNATANSSVADENTALTVIESIIDQVKGTASQGCFLVDSFHNLAYVSGSDKEPIYENLNEYSKHFENKEKLVKLNDWEIQAKAAIEKALNGEDNQTEIETLLKKIMGTHNKVKPEFLEEIKKSDSTLVDLKTLLGKEPKEIITLIARFTYNQLDDTGEEKNKKKTQKRRRIAKKLNKAKESDLSEQELNESLYQLETGELTIDTSKSWTADLKEISATTPQQEEQKGEETGEPTANIEEKEEDDKDPFEHKQFCWSCSLDSLRKFELGDYPVKNKEQIIKELRAALMTDNSEVQLDYYE
ncbi:9596_t:CDS:2 [Cetraspora pellucida]|uniref:9596_t:CDS:1 n=1 Tax=Cetraspora pellucida TaxID=1433469 RepID=A0ACA9LXI3_9GLOM|nr:9596_t:CDS:2 [Cetraspora pellucida]